MTLRINDPKKLFGLFFQLCENLRHIKKKPLHLLPIEFKTIPFPKEVAKAKILSKFFLRVRRYYSGSQAGYIQGHLMEEFAVPFLSCGQPSVHLFCNIFKNLLHACIEIMKD